jgi:hypothetical protein
MVTKRPEPLGPESYIFYGPNNAWRVRRANACAQGACHTQGSSRPARYRFRSSVHNRRRSIGSALRSTRTLPTVRVPARTDNIALPPVPPRECVVDTRLHRNMLHKIGIIPKVETPSRLDGKATGRDTPKDNSAGSAEVSSSPLHHAPLPEQPPIGVPREKAKQWVIEGCRSVRILRS